MNHAQQEFAPRSALAWSQACAAALPNAARQILRQAHIAGGYQVDAADAFIACMEQKSEAQARSKARRQNTKGWGTGARVGEDDAAEADQFDPLSTPHGMGEWARYQDPAAAREALEIRAAFEICDVVAALESAGLSNLVQDPAAVARLQGEMKRWEAQADIDEADTAAIALRDRVTLRMAQLALKAQRESIERGQGVLL